METWTKKDITIVEDNVILNLDVLEVLLVVGVEFLYEFIHWKNYDDWFINDRDI